MTDQITSCATYKDGAIIKYHVIDYTLTSGKQFKIYVDASEMSDPSDNTELKTLANAKAADAKATLVASPQTETFDTTLNGDVTI